jgi:hypothetical protein
MAVERHVFNKFGHYYVYEGTLIARGLTRDQAERWAAGDDEGVAREVMLEKLEALRTRRESLYADRASLQKEIHDLEQTAGKRAAYQKGQKERALEKVERALKSLLDEEVAHTEATKPTTTGGIRLTGAQPAAEDMIAELERVTAECDQSGATAKDAARVENLLARLRFAGHVKHSAEAARTQIERLMKPVALSPSDRRMRWSMFVSWARHSAAAPVA